MPARRKIGNSVRDLVEQDEYWSLIALHDGDLYGTLTRTGLTLRLGNDIDGRIV